MAHDSTIDYPDFIRGLPDDQLHILAVATLSSEQQDRLNLLLERNRQQTLTPDEEDELDRFLKRIDYLNILKAKARLTLRYREFLARTGQLSSQPPTRDETSTQDRIAGTIAEIDLERLDAGRDMTPAQRMQHAVALIEEAEQAAVESLRSVWPELSEAEALRIYRSRDSDD